MKDTLQQDAKKFSEFIQKHYPGGAGMEGPGWVLCVVYQPFFHRCGMR